MNGLDEILQAIKEDARKEAERISGDARKRVEEIEAETALEKEKIDAEHAAVANKMRERELERLNSLSHLEAREMILAAKQKAIDGVYLIALDRLRNMSDEEKAKIGVSPETAVRMIRDHSIGEVGRILFGEGEASGEHTS